MTNSKRAEMHYQWTKKAAEESFTKMPSEHELRTLGIVAWNAGYDAAKAEESEALRVAVEALDKIRNQENWTLDSGDEGLTYVGTIAVEALATIKRLKGE